MTYVPGQFIPYIFLAPSHKRIFSKMGASKACGHVTYGWLGCIQIWYGCSLGISEDLINFGDESIKYKMAAAAI